MVSHQVKLKAEGLLLVLTIVDLLYRHSSKGYGTLSVGSGYVSCRCKDFIGDRGGLIARCNEIDGFSQAESICHLVKSFASGGRCRVIEYGLQTA